MLTPKLVLKLIPAYLIMAAVFAWPIVSANIIAKNTRESNKRYLNSVLSHTEQTISGQPTLLEIPRLKIKLNVEKGGFDAATGQWILGWQAVYFAEGTALPNNKLGNTLVYGHDVMKVLKPTKRLVEGDQLIISTNNGYRLEYFFQGAENVKPHDVSILSKKSKAPQLTLLTCTGSFEQFRRLMTFKYLRKL